MKLQPVHCPFCQSAKVSIFECDVGSWAVTCGHCQAIGPSAAAAGEAVRRWNSVMLLSSRAGAAEKMLDAG